MTKINLIKFVDEYSYTCIYFETKTKNWANRKEGGWGGGDKFYHNVNLNVAGMILELR